jgi:aspartate carbamoyltransferase regulatory subunit
MNVDKITNGIVIDHIPAGRAMTLYRDLMLDTLTCQVAIIKNAPSNKMGRKDLLKIGESIDINHEILGFMDPGITVNIIKNGETTDKFRPTMPEELKNIIFCKNPRCITSTEQEVSHVFRLTNREKTIYRCIYCESKAK